MGKISRAHLLFPFKLIENSWEFVVVFGKLLKNVIKMAEENKSVAKLEELFIFLKNRKNINCISKILWKSCKINKEFMFLINVLKPWFIEESVAFLTVCSWYFSCL